MNLDRKLAKLARLESERSRLLAEGKCLYDCWVGLSYPGGNASIAAKQKPYPQLRSTIAQFDGKKSRYLKVDEVAECRAAIVRGRQVRKLGKAIAVLKQQVGAAVGEP
jgi:hypothetical protein